MEINEIKKIRYFIFDWYHSVGNFKRTFMNNLSDIEKTFEECNLNVEFRHLAKEDWTKVTSLSSFNSTVYSWEFLNYRTIYFNSFSKDSLDISVVIYHDNKPCALWPLIFDNSDHEPLRSINNQFGGVVVPPLFVDNFPKKSQRTVIKSCINFLNKILASSGGKHWRTNEVSTEGNSGQWHQVALETGGVLDRVNYEMYVDLSLSIEEIRSHIRKSFRPLVSSGLKKWNIGILDDSCETTWNNFRELHRNTAGRITRSSETWDIQYENIRSGDAFLVYVSGDDGLMVGGGYFDMSNYESRYSVGSYDKELFDQPLGHMIQYQAILTAKEKGRKIHYLGDRFYKEELPFVENKRVQISYFQQGFSTHVFPRVGLLFKA